MSAFRLSMGDHQNRLRLVDGPPPPQKLTEKYRPSRLADVVGQGPVIFELEAFLEAPYSTAMLFEGPTGVGKTTVAKAIATELGACEFGGLEEIKSGMQDQDAVLRVLNNLRFTPMMGSGWKVVICDEADMMSTYAQRIWLSALEDLPSRSVIVFTTNSPEKFPDRFLDRCMRFSFEAKMVDHIQDAQALIDRIWRAEQGADSTPPAAIDLGGITDREGNLSYRRVVEAIRGRLDGRKTAPVRPAESPIPIPSPAPQLVSEPPKPSKSVPEGLTPSQKGNITWWRNQLAKAERAGDDAQQARWRKKLEEAGVL